eukprot:gnl/TRDRNA2_/TRDRNA2_207984_c0_seq1.p3 gnl/TRDRNA2_/TRDRNA2_207984_c0~~gnl/TRDRNA2_/TRDRNA2_207984_c0_seq1.p3  ORF type:complete len:104 (-),score=6.06 gnl/TRDRNA2_/TRDRNA2_207984_c0_seq1:112-423(-)
MASCWASVSKSKSAASTCSLTPPNPTCVSVGDWFKTPTERMPGLAQWIENGCKRDDYWDPTVKHPECKWDLAKANDEPASAGFSVLPLAAVTTTIMCVFVSNM